MKKTRLSYLKFLLIGLVVFCSTSAMAQSIHGDLETWRTVSAGGSKLESPQGWYSTDSIIFMVKYVNPGANLEQQVFKTTDAHGGNNAAKIKTVLQDMFGLTAGLLTNTHPDIDFQQFNQGNLKGSAIFTGGTPINERAKGISAWIKYHPFTADTATITVLAVITGKGSQGKDSFVTVGQGTLNVSDSMKDYALVHVPIQYTNATAVPDKIQVFFNSSNNAPVDGSTLFVDDVLLHTESGIDMPLMSDNRIDIYPVPSTGTLCFHTQSAKNFILKAYTIDGKEVLVKKVTNGNPVDVSALPNGLYFYQITDLDGNNAQAGKFMISK